MRKPQPDSPTKRKLLAAAQNLMLAKGFTATTVDDVCESARLTKGSFFHYFETKEALGKAVLDRYVSTMFQAIQDAPFLKKDDPLQRIYGYVDFLIEMSRTPPSKAAACSGPSRRSFWTPIPASGRLVPSISPVGPRPSGWTSRPRRPSTPEGNAGTPRHWPSTSS